MTGGYAGGPGQHLDFDTTQVHSAPNTFSDLAFRGVLAAGSTAVWRGMIRVDPGAQQTDAFQESRNLLLSPDAHADAIPGLEIEADDVRCTHAAAIAQVDREQLFYLTSRGLDPAAAKQLIIEGFLESLVERLAEGPVREEISAALERRLSPRSSSSATRRERFTHRGHRVADICRRPRHCLLIYFGRETGRVMGLAIETTCNLSGQSTIWPTRTGIGRKPRGGRGDSAGWTAPRRFTSSPPRAGRGRSR